MGTRGSLPSRNSDLGWGAADGFQTPLPRGANVPSGPPGWMLRLSLLPGGVAGAGPYTQPGGLVVFLMTGYPGSCHRAQGNHGVEEDRCALNKHPYLSGALSAFSLIHNYP